MSSGEYICSTCWRKDCDCSPQPFGSVISSAVGAVKPLAENFRFPGNNRCAACGREQWQSNSVYDASRHCLRHTGQVRSCEERELTRLRTENADLRERLGRLERSFKTQVDGRWIAWWPAAIVANGWEPFDQPGDEYMPRSFAEFTRIDLLGGQLLIQRDERIERFAEQLRGLLATVELAIGVAK